jgi:hypothetical protein
MFRYGLVGNTIIYGGGMALAGYIGWELYQIPKDGTKMPEHLAREVFTAEAKPTQKFQSPGLR